MRLKNKNMFGWESGPVLKNDEHKIVDDIEDNPKYHNEIWGMVYGCVIIASNTKENFTSEDVIDTIEAIAYNTWKELAQVCLEIKGLESTDDVLKILRIYKKNDVITGSIGRIDQRKLCNGIL